MTEQVGLDGGFFAGLKEQNRGAWDRCLHHPFIERLWEGQISDGVIGTYLVQDYMFCDLFVALLGRAVSLAPELDERLGFARVLGEFASDENTYFRDAFAELGISDDARAGTMPGPATNGFLRLMESVVSGDSYLDVLALLAVAEILYGEWASLRPDSQRPTRALHADWIRIHNNPVYNPWIVWLQERFDRAAERASALERQQASSVFGNAVDLELSFFDQAYELTR